MDIYNKQQSPITSFPDDGDRVSETVGSELTWLVAQDFITGNKSFDSAAEFKYLE
jgi:hypothetical protein